MNRTIQITLAIAVVAVAMLGAATSVFAHAGYDHSVPARDEVVPDSPERVEVFFEQDVVKREGLYYVRVFDEAGTQVSDGDGVVNDDDRSNINAELPSPLSPGRYIVEWLTTSDIDGDDATGKFCLYVDVEPTEAQEAECAEFEEELAPTATIGSTQAEPTPTVMAGTSDDDDGSNRGLIIGIVVVVVAVVAVAGGGIALLSRRE